jgi:hypothetical protein
MARVLRRRALLPKTVIPLSPGAACQRLPLLHRRAEEAGESDAEEDAVFTGFGDNDKLLADDGFGIGAGSDSELEAEERGTLRTTKRLQTTKQMLLRMKMRQTTLTLSL